MEKRDKKHVKFTYVWKETNVITKLFKQTKLKIVFTTNNSIEKYSEIKFSCITIKTYTHMLKDKILPNAKKTVY